MKFTFLSFSVKAVFTESGKDLADVLLVLSWIVGIDEDVVQIDNNAYIKQIAEHIIHEALKSSRGVR